MNHSHRRKRLPARVFPLYGLICNLKSAILRRNPPLQSRRSFVQTLVTYTSGVFTWLNRLLTVDSKKLRRGHGVSAVRSTLAISMDTCTSVSTLPCPIASWRKSLGAFRQKIIDGLCLRCTRQERIRSRNKTTTFRRECCPSYCCASVDCRGRLRCSHLFRVYCPATSTAAYGSQLHSPTPAKILLPTEHSSLSRP